MAREMKEKLLTCNVSIPFYYYIFFFLVRVLIPQNAIRSKLKPIKMQANGILLSLAALKAEKITTSLK